MKFDSNLGTILNPYHHLDTDRMWTFLEVIAVPQDANIDSVLALVAIEKLIRRTRWQQPDHNPGFETTFLTVLRTIGTDIPIRIILARLGHDLLWTSQQFIYEPSRGATPEKVDTWIINPPNNNLSQKLRQIAAEDSFIIPSIAVKRYRNRLRAELEYAQIFGAEMCGIVLSFIFDMPVARGRHLRNRLLQYYLRSQFDARDVRHLAWCSAEYIKSYLRRFCPGSSVVKKKPMKYLWCVINYCNSTLSARLPILNLVGVYSDRDRAAYALRDKTETLPSGHVCLNTAHHYRPRIVQVAADGGVLRTQWGVKHPHVLARGIKNTQPAAAYRPPSYSHTRDVYFIVVPEGLRFFLSREEAKQALCGESVSVCLGGMPHLTLPDAVWDCRLNCALDDGW